MFQGRRCAECGKVALDEGRLCPYCGGQGGSSVSLSGRGRLLSWTVISVAPSRYAAEAPYVVGVLDLDEGIRITARLQGEPDQLKKGQPVTFSSLDPARGPIFKTV